MHQASPTVEYTLLDQQLMSRARRYFAWQAQMVKPHLGRRVIEVGCGVGNFTGYLLDSEAAISLDAVEECVEHARARFPAHPNLQFRCLDVQDPVFLDLQAFHPDTILCLNVLEHVRDDALALEHMRRILAPGGRAIFLLPAFESLYGLLDRNMGHFRRYSKRSWRALAERSGFRVSEARYFNFIGFFAWWANTRLLRLRELSPAQIDWFDRLAVPLESRIERWIAPPLGQSIFSALEKSA